MGLQVYPELRAGSEKESKSQSCVSSYGPLSLDYFVNPPSWNTDILGKPVLAYSHWLQKILKENFSRMYRFQFLIHAFLSVVVICYLHVMGNVSFPLETYPPLIVDPYAVLPFPVAIQLFEAITWRDPQVTQIGCRMQVQEFPQGRPTDICMELPRTSPVEYFLGFLACKARYHQ